MKHSSYETFFATLSGSRRMEILQYLKTAGSQNVTDIAKGTGMEQSAVSHSLNKLLTCEFVHIEVRGKHRYYVLNNETILPLLEIIEQHIEKFCKGKCGCCNTNNGMAEDISAAVPTGLGSSGRTK